MIGSFGGKGLKLGIMQPYFLPYIGYFQLVSAVDTFIVYDNIKYTKKGWINRNRALLNGSDFMFSLPLKKGSDSLDVVQRELAADFDREKLLNQFRASYSRAPQFNQSYPLLERIVRCEEKNLFQYVYHSIIQLHTHLDIKTEIIISSSIPIDHSLKSQDKVLALCKAAGADTYINTIGGLGLYSKDAFRKQGIDLRFIEPRPLLYAQFGEGFVPWLSIVDVLMFNPLNMVRSIVSQNYSLI
jgi:hypothetical protein